MIETRVIIVNHDTDTGDEAVVNEYISGEIQFAPDPEFHGLAMFAKQLRWVPPAPAAPEPEPPAAE